MNAEVRRETCPVCGRKIRMTRGSRIWNHKRPTTDEDPHRWPPVCEGSGGMSKERIALLHKMDETVRKGKGIEI